jgi:hypothetical protein
MARKILTIGITINLENYENLRLEVQGEVGDDGNAEPIIAYLDGMLARLGHGDEATRHAGGRGAPSGHHRPITCPEGRRGPSCAPGTARATRSPPRSPGAGPCPGAEAG